MIVLTSYEDAKKKTRQLEAFRFFKKLHDHDRLLKAIEEAIGPGDRS